MPPRAIFASAFFVTPPSWLAVIFFQPPFSAEFVSAFIDTPILSFAESAIFTPPPGGLLMPFASPPPCHIFFRPLQARLLHYALSHFRRRRAPITPSRVSLFSPLLIIDTPACLIAFQPLLFTPRCFFACQRYFADRLFLPLSFCRLPRPYTLLSPRYCRLSEL